MLSGAWPFFSLLIRPQGIDIPSRKNKYAAIIRPTNEDLTVVAQEWAPKALYQAV
jgi:hypothetical protein